jgi:hypothetical protein
MKIFLFIPSYRPIESNAFLATHALLPALAKCGVAGSLASASYCYLQELRNIALTIFYDLTDATHLLFVDSDIGFHHNLVLDMLAFGQPLVGAMYPQRSMPPTWAGSFFEGERSVRCGDFIKMEAVGMGVTLIRRDVVDVMLEKMPELSDDRPGNWTAVLDGGKCKRIIRAFDNLDLGPRGLAFEDVAFCMRWGRCGGEVWANIAYRISHVGPYDYGACYKDVMTVAEKMNAEAAA